MQIKPTVPSLKHKRHWNSACTSLHRLGAIRQGRVKADSSSALGSNVWKPRERLVSAGRQRVCHRPSLTAV